MFKKLMVILLVGCVPITVHAAQTTLVDGATMATQLSAINANDTELYSHADSVSDPHGTWLDQVENLTVNLTATAAPTDNDDIDTGNYDVGSRWIDITNDREYVCVDNTDTAAVWIETTGGGSLSADSVDDTHIDWGTGASQVSAVDVPADITNFNNNLSASDTTVQAALETLDELASGGSDITLNADVTTGNYDGVALDNWPAGETIAQFDMVYFDATALEWLIADADAAGEWPAWGMAVEAGTDGIDMAILESGVITNSAWAWTADDILYLDETTAGGLTTTAPSTDDDGIQPVARALSATTIILDVNPIHGYGKSGTLVTYKEASWVLFDSSASTSSGDGEKAFVVPSSMTGMDLSDVTCSVASLNSATGGATTVVVRRVRAGTAVDMTSTGVTIDFNAYTASDEVVNTSNDDITTGDNLYVDVNSITTGAVQLGLSCTAIFRLP